MSHTPPTRFRYDIAWPSPDPVGTGLPAHDIDRGVNRMSAHPGEFSEGTHSIPQDWASLARYLARRGIVLGPGQPRQFAGGYGTFHHLSELDRGPAVSR